MLKDTLKQSLKEEIGDYIESDHDPNKIAFYYLTKDRFIRRPQGIWIGSVPEYKLWDYAMSWKPLTTPQSYFRWILENQKIWV